MRLRKPIALNWDEPKEGLIQIFASHETLICLKKKMGA